MQRLPEKGKGGPLAIGLVVAVALVVYAGGFHWFVLKHQHYNARIAEQRQQLEDFKTRAAQREHLREQLEEVRRYQANNDYFLSEGKFSLAAAELQSRIKGLVSSNSSQVNECQVVSVQNIRPRGEERFQRVTVKARLRCDLDSLREVVYQLENGTPLLFLDDVNIYERHRRDSDGRLNSYLDVRFDVTGYLRAAS